MYVFTEIKKDMNKLDGYILELEDRKKYWEDILKSIDDGSSEIESILQQLEYQIEEIEYKKLQLQKTEYDIRKSISIKINRLDEMENALIAELEAELKAKAALNVEDN